MGNTATDRPLDRFMREPEIEERSGLSRTTRWRMVRRGEFPRPRKISPNASGTLESEYRAWEAEQRAQSADAEGELGGDTEAT